MLIEKSDLFSVSQPQNHTNSNCYCPHFMLWPPRPREWRKRLEVTQDMSMTTHSALPVFSALQWGRQTASCWRIRKGSTKEMAFDLGLKIWLKFRLLERQGKVCSGKGKSLNKGMDIRNYRAYTAQSKIGSVEKANWNGCTEIHDIQAKQCELPSGAIKSQWEF